MRNVNGVTHKAVTQKQMFTVKRRQWRQFTMYEQKWKVTVTILKISPFHTYRLYWYISVKRSCVRTRPYQKYQQIRYGNLPVWEVVTSPVNSQNDAVCECRMKITGMSMYEFRTRWRKMFTLWNLCVNGVFLEKQIERHYLCKQCFFIFI